LSAGRRALAVSALAWGLAFVSPLRAEGRRNDRVDELVRVLLRDGSYKVRLQAAVVLGKIHDRRAVPGLVQALGDSNFNVRGMAAEALGEIGDESARVALVRASHDGNSFVRTQAQAALRVLDAVPPAGSISSRNSVTGEKIFLAVGRMGDRTGRASSELRDRMRQFVLAQLSGTPYVSLHGPAAHARGFIVDGAIRELLLRTQRDYIEASCEVELVISTYPSHSIVMMTTGGATVQTPRLRYRAREDGSMERDALENAVRGAHQNLLQFLEAQR